MNDERNRIFKKHREMLAELLDFVHQPLTKGPAMDYDNWKSSNRKEEDFQEAYARYEDLSDTELLTTYVGKRAKQGLELTVRDLMVRWLAEDERSA